MDFKIHLTPFQRDFVYSDTPQLTWQTGRGGGKTTGLLCAAVEKANRGFHALIIVNEGRTHWVRDMLPTVVDADSYIDDPALVRFPSGGTVTFASIDEDLQKFRGCNFQFLGYDDYQILIETMAQEYEKLAEALRYDFTASTPYLDKVSWLRMKFRPMEYGQPTYLRYVRT
jgi:hypothetical protein